MKPRIRLTPKTRKKQIFETALAFSKRHGYAKLTTSAVANKLNISRALVHYYFIDLQNLQSEVINTAIQEKIFSILIEAITYNHPLAKAIPQNTRRELKKWI